MSHVPALSSNGHAASALVRLRNKMFFDTEYFDGSFALLNAPKGVGPYFVTIHSTLHFLSSDVPSHQCQRHGVVASEPTMKGERVENETNRYKIWTLVSRLCQGPVDLGLELGGFLYSLQISHQYLSHCLFRSSLPVLCTEIC